MEMLQCRFILASLLVLSGCFFKASCQTVVTYTTKNAESLPCTISELTPTVTWTEGATGNVVSVLSYQSGTPPVIIKSPEKKYENFNYTLEPTSLNLVIMDVEDEDGGVYTCAPFGLDPAQFLVTVEVIPGTFSLNCFVPPDVACPEQSVIPTSELVCTCVANGVRPGTLYLDITNAYDVQQNESNKIGNLFDLRLKATVPVTESMTGVTCSVKGYNTSEPIPSELITTTFMISPPTCSLEVSFDHKCTEATLTCSCSASPTNGEPPGESPMVYSYFNGTGHIIVSETTTTALTNDVAAGAVNTYSCRGCNGLYYDNASYVTKSSECTISTTAPLSTNELTSTKAMGTTTVEPESKSTDNPESGGLGTGAIVGISLGALAVVIVFVVIALMMFKPGKCGSKSDRSNIHNGIANGGIETPLPIYAEVKNERNTVKHNDPTPGPCSLTSDTKNSSKHPEQQTSDPSFGQEPPSNEPNF